jgi:hypothetical protein
MAILKNIVVDDDIYKALETQKGGIESITGVTRSMEDFASMLIFVGFISLGKAMTPKSDTEMNDFIISLMGEPGAEEPDFIKRIYKLMTAQRRIGYRE